MGRSRMNGLREAAYVQSDGLERQVKAICNIAARVVAFLLAALALNQVAVPLALASEPPFPKLKTKTEAAFERYVRLAEARNEGGLKRGTDLLWVDGLPPEQRAEAYAALKRGEIKLQKLEIFDNDKPIACPGGMIHHWFRRHKVITVVLNTEHEVRYFHDAPGRAHSRSSAVRIAEVENAGKGDEREKIPGDDDGFMWRMETWWRMEERDGGVYVQSEVASLTRDVPTGFGWMINPFVTGIPKESLTFTLEATRKAVEAHRTAR